MTTPKSPSLEAPSLERLEELARAASPNWDSELRGDRAVTLYIAALSPDVALWLVGRIRELEAEARANAKAVQRARVLEHGERMRQDCARRLEACTELHQRAEAEAASLRSRVQELEAERQELAGELDATLGRCLSAECYGKAAVAERDAARAALDALRFATGGFCAEVDALMAHYGERVAGGQQVPFFGDFANVQPSAGKRLKWWADRFRAALGAETPAARGALEEPCKYATPEQRQTFRDVVEEILDTGNVERATDHLIRFVAACVDYYRDKPVRVMGCEFQPPPKEEPADDGVLHDRLHDTAQLGSRVARSVKNPGKPPPKEEPDGR